MRNVELVILGDSAQILQAVILSDDGAEVRLKVDGAVEVGCRVCIRESNTWLYGKVEHCEGQDLRINVRGTSTSDRREFSRVYGAIQTRYQVVKGDSTLACKRWMSRGESTQGPWFVPDPFMDFSGSGLMFHDQETCSDGDTLLMELRVQGSEEVFRVTADVVRLLLIAPEERDETPFAEGAAIPSHRVAVHFLEAPANVIHALVEFAAKIQEAFL